MEHSPIFPDDFEEESEDDVDLARSKNFLESLFKTAKNEKQATKELSIIEELKNIDKNPELDSEAPVEELSEIERTVIARNVAQERLTELQDDDQLARETIASQTYFEDLYETGDLDLAWQQATRELNIDPDQTSIETNTYPEDEPNDMSADRPIVTPGSSSANRDPVTRSSFEEDNLMAWQPAIPQPEKPALKNKEINKPKSKVEPSLIDTLLYRRKARIEERPKNTEVLTSQLTREVTKLTDRIIKNETIIRQKAVSQPTFDRLKESPIQAVPQTLEQIKTKSRPEKTTALNDQEVKPIIPFYEQTSPNDQVIEQPQSSLRLRRKELLLIASKVEVQGISLKKMHENRQISEKGLRRIIEVYLRGGNVKKALRRELIEREIDFERDPAVRDQGFIDNPSREASDNKIDALLKKSGFDWEDRPSRPNPNFSLKTLVQSNQKPSKKPFKVLDALLIIIILLLLIIVIVIFFKYY